MGGCGGETDGNAVKKTGRHPAGIARVLGVVALIVAAVVLGGCGVTGRVYIAFFWAASDYPDATFVCSAPNVPVLMTSMVKGRYYETVPGTYALQYSYTTGESHTLFFTVAADSTLLGQQNAYYHATLRKLSAPTVEPYP
jgi:hypothetical protein